MAGGSSPLRKTHAQAAAGEYDPIESSLRPQILAYLEALESQGRYKLMVWPVHCVIGAWGHNIHGGVLEALGEWSRRFNVGRSKC